MTAGPMALEEPPPKKGLIFLFFTFFFGAFLKLRRSRGAFSAANNSRVGHGVDLATSQRQTASLWLFLFFFYFSLTLHLLLAASLRPFSWSPAPSFFLPPGLCTLSGIVAEATSQGHQQRGTKRREKRGEDKRREEERMTEGEVSNKV